LIVIYENFQKYNIEKYKHFTYLVMFYDQIRNSTFLLTSFETLSQ